MNGVVRRSLALLVVAAALVVCKRQTRDEEFVDIGVIDNTTDSAPGIHPRIGRGDLAAIAEAGRWVDQAARALDIADAAVVDRMGKLAHDVVMPLVDIDPGGASGQVIFVRWPNAAKSTEPLRAANAQRWVLVALMLDPPRVVDIELLHGNPEPNSTEARRIDALHIASAALQSKATGQAFYTVDRFVEEPVEEKKRRSKVVSIVYALAQNEQGPDLEIAVDEPAKRGKPPLLLRAQIVHPKGTLQADPVVVQWPDPHPLTVARALERDPEGKPLSVRVQSGLYAVSTKDGSVERVGP
jgi:hypothetical protein